jgi:trimethylamine--corrinoid protein Co-methyltransferase
LAEESLRKCPKRVLLKGRTREYDVVVGDPYVHFASAVCMDTLDLETNNRKTPTRQDLISLIKVLDYLDEVHIIMLPYTNLEGVSGLGLYPELFHAQLEHTSKVIITAGILGNEVWTIRMAQALNRTLLAALQCSPPLTWNSDQIESTFHHIEAGFPVFPGTGLALGATSPVTLAGSLVQQLAEIISITVLVQIVKPGTGIVAKSRIEPVDMRTGAIAEGGIEKAIADAAWNQIWRWYGIPRFHTCVSTDSKVPDYQCGIEKALHVVLSALTGSNFVAGIGSIYDEITASPVVAIMDNDLIHRVVRIIEGVKVNEETLAVDLINEVGPLPGHFLNTQHTRSFWRSELCIPDLADRVTYSEWKNQGQKISLDYAKQKYDEIMATYNPTPLPTDKKQAIDEILDEARAFYKKTEET